MKWLVAAGLLLSSVTTAAAQVTPDQVHQDATGPSTICGITGRDAADLMRIVRQTRRFKEQPINSPRFELFSSDDSLTQWVFTRPSETAYPAVSCRRVFKDREGGLSQSRELRCDASRDACDRIFVEFRDLDEKARQAFE